MQQLTADLSAYENGFITGGTQPRKGNELSQGERRLAAIMFTDIVGYTSLSQKNEPLTIQLLEEHRKLVRPFFLKHNGREVNMMGDAFLVEFASALEAVRCAVEIQSAIKDVNGKSPFERRILVRIGIHLGDVIHEGSDVVGDAVNVASRIEHLAPPGGICVSAQVQASVVNKVEQVFQSLGVPELKNVATPIEVFCVSGFGEQVGMAVPQKATQPSGRIAVLPFANMSPDPQDEYFADGMTEEVISTLSKVRDFEVISRTSVMQYKKTPKPIIEVSKELNAGTILEGSIRKAGSRLRITVQMIDAARDRHLWAESYDRDFRDVFAIQGDIAARVADALRVRIFPGEKADLAKRPTSSTEAYTLYLKGRYLWNKRGIDEVKKAAEFFEQAVNEDPAFALGYVGLADCCVILRGNWRVEPDVNLEKAKTMVAKALELDPELAEAHATNGSTLMDEYHLRQAEEEFRKAIELKPSYAFAHMWYHLLLAKQLRWDEALEQIEKAVELDPLSPQINYNHANFYLNRRDYRKALELFEKVTALDPGFSDAHSGMAVAYGKMKMYDDMRRELATFVQLLRDRYPLVRMGADAQIAYLEDERQTLRRLLPELEAHMQEAGWNAYSSAYYYFYLGENEKGFEWLERSYSKREYSLIAIKLAWTLDGVRTDPRYIDLLKRLGLE